MDPEVETKVVPAPAADSTAVAAVSVDMSGRRTVGRYELLQRLGHGGMATVYLARARGLGGFEKLVAVKVIHPHLAAEPEFVAMFLNEARVAARLSSPHIGEVLDVGEDAGLYFMVMEYIEGETLSALLRVLRERGERVASAVALQIVADACQGLSTVHELRDESGNPYELVHRDVSPQNLLITMDGWVKLVDFGIVKATGIGRSTLTGHLRGKLPYMAPEQARGRALSRSSDVFALGVVLWELCAGRRLFDGGNDAETLTRVMRCDVPPLRDVLPAGEAIPTSLQELLSRALAPDPDERFPSATAMLGAVQAVLHELSAGAAPRERLSETMRASFGERVAYRRAAARSRQGAAPAISLVRATSEHELDTGGRINVGASSRQPAVIRALSVVGGGDEVAELTPARAGGMSLGSGAPAAVDEPHTLTTLSAPSRSWSLWLLLPFLGAGIAVMAINFSAGRRDDGGPDESAQVGERGRDEPASPRVEVASVDASGEPEEPARVTWLVSTEPAGARIVSLAGLSAERGQALLEQIGEQVTPVKLELSFQRDPVTVTLEKDGFRARTVVRMPVADENIVLRLEPERPSSVNKRLARSNNRLKGRTSARTRPGPERRQDDADSTKVGELPAEPSFKPLRPREEE